MATVVPNRRSTFGMTCVQCHEGQPRSFDSYHRR